MGSVRSDFSSYWNQVTPENAGKWGSVEVSQGSYNWSPLDDIYNYAVTNHYRYKHHNLVWGNQQPSWISSLDSASQRTEVQTWIQLVCERYGSMSFVDVVNEPFNAPPPYANALGGAGATGWDWAVTAFAWARQYAFPGIKLILNEYNVLQSNAVTDNYLALIDTLRVRGLIDAIGIQGHYFEFKSSAGALPAYTYPISTIKSNLDRLTATGLPVYITEFDVDEANDSIQLANYQTYFPLFWEDPGVKGMTLWGYVQGLTWKPNAYLLRTNGTERPALQWLRRYVATPLPPVIVSPSGTSGEPRDVLLIWHPSNLTVTYHLQVSTTRGFITPDVDTTAADTLIRLNPLASNTTYYWRVSAVNDSGASSYAPYVGFTTGSQIAAVGESRRMPAEFVLAQNYPNPFNPGTTIGYQLPTAGFVTLKVFDLLGREVATLVDEREQPGEHTVHWDASGVASGVYFCRLMAGGFVATEKLTVLR